MKTFLNYESLIINRENCELQNEIKLHPQIVHLVDDDQVTLLMSAVYYQNYEIVECLITNGADVNKKDRSKWTALMYAGYRSNIESVRYLLEQGANPSIRTSVGLSVFEMIFQSKKRSLPWFELFALYKDQLDEEDLACYHKQRLPLLFA